MLNSQIWYLYCHAGSSNKNLRKRLRNQTVHSFSLLQSLSVLIFWVKSILQFGDIDACTFFIELDLKRPYPARGTDLSKWEVWNSDFLKILLYINIYFFPFTKINPRIKVIFVNDVNTKFVRLIESSIII